MKHFIFILFFAFAFALAQSNLWVVGYRYMPYDPVTYLGISYEAVVLNTSTNSTNASFGRPDTATTGWRVYNPLISGSPVGALNKVSVTITGSSGDVSPLQDIRKMTEIQTFTLMISGGFVVLGIMWRITRG